MSVIRSGDEAVLIRAAQAEVLGEDPVAVTLLADSSSTNGLLSTQRVTLGAGANGAVPHLHQGSAETFYVLDGVLQVLAGEQVTTAERGDFLVVPAGMAHAFAAAQGERADVLITIIPGVERFEYFRLLARVARGEATRQDVLATQERFDNHFLDSPAWTAARGR